MTSDPHSDERRMLWEGSIAAAFGAGAGTLLAIAFGAFWIFGTILGGAVGFVAYRPGEVLRTTAALVATIGRAMRSGAVDERIRAYVREKHMEIARAVLGGVLLVSIPIIGAMISTIGIVYALGILCSWHTDTHISLLLALAILASITSGIIIAYWWVFLTFTVKMWGTRMFPLSRVAFRIAEQSLVRCDDHIVTMQRASSFGAHVAQLLLLALAGAVIPIGLCVLAVMVWCVWIVESILALILTLATTARLAAFTGALIGSLGGYLVHASTGADASLAVTIGAAIGIGAFHLAYRARRWMDARPTFAYGR